MWFSGLRSAIQGDCLKFASALTLAVASMIVSMPRAEAQAVAIAEIAGHVTDQTGQSVVSAQVKMIEVDRAQVHNTTTNADGLYSLPNLPIGAYRLEVAAPGFKT